MIGEVVSGRKNLKIRKNCWNRNSSETVGRRKKRNPSVELLEPILEEVDQKAFNLAKTFSTK